MEKTRAEKITTWVLLGVPTVIDIFLIAVGVELLRLSGAAAAQADMGYHYLIGFFGPVAFVFAAIGVILFLTSGAKFRDTKVIYLLVVGLLPVVMYKMFMKMF